MFFTGVFVCGFRFLFVVGFGVFLFGFVLVGFFLGGLFISLVVV